MGLVADVVARLEAEVPWLAHRVDGAAALQDVLSRKNLPQGAQPAAYVLPSGQSGGREMGPVGAFRQEVERLVSVILVIPNAGATGGRKVDELEDRTHAITTALVPWTPPSVHCHVFRLQRGRMLSLTTQLIAYDLTFAIKDEIRE